jgi:hypothetical protein
LWEIGPYRLRGLIGFQKYQDRDSLNSVSVKIRDQESTSTGAHTSSTVFTNLGEVGGKSARVWLIGHDLWLWSPKGFLTGSSNTPGSILFGQHFERTDADCGVSGRIHTFGTADLSDNAICNRITLSSSTSKTEFSRNRILLREWDLWYFIAPRASVGLNFLWYDASNLPTGFSSSSGFNNDVQKNLGAKGGCRNRAHNTAVDALQASWVLDRSGCGGDWLDVWLRLRWSF